MVDTVIVALPPVDDRVNKISSEKEAHLTLLYLGKANLSAEAILYVQHACAELSPFGATVDYRGPLGADDADVLYFEDNAYDLRRVKEFRHYLLLNDEIKRAYDSTDQFPEWTPHLTLGFPETPANEDDEDYKLSYVHFDRIAVWTGDFEGPEFRLKYDDYAMEVAMSDISTADRGRIAVGELFHYGVKGMKWGVRRTDAQISADKQAVNVTQKKPGSFAKTTGGKGLPISEDARIALEGRQKAKASTTDALSNTELRKVVERMNLEQQYEKLAFQSDRRGKGQRFVQGLLGVKRYGGKDKRRYSDFNEEAGEKAREAMRSETAKQAAAAVGAQVLKRAASAAV